MGIPSPLPYDNAAETHACFFSPYIGSWTNSTLVLTRDGEFDNFDKGEEIRPILKSPKSSKPARGAPHDPKDRQRRSKWETHTPLEICFRGELAVFGRCVGNARKKMLFYQRFKDKVSTAIRWLNCFRENAVRKILLQGDLLDA